MLNEIIKTAEELNTAALYYRQSGNMDGVRELAKAHAVSKKQTEEFIQGSRYRLVDIPIEERTFANASEKLRAEMFAFSDGEYQVIAPKSIDDILYEGDTLHHCVSRELGTGRTSCIKTV